MSEEKKVHHYDPSLKMHGSVVVGTKGQIVIPSEVRKTLSIVSGDNMCVVTKYGKAVGLVKMDDLEDFTKYLEQEMAENKSNVCDPNVKMCGSVVVGTKGQIVIPSEVRKTLSIVSGDNMCVVTKYGKAVGLVKMDDLEDFTKYLEQEMETAKHMNTEK